MYTNASPRAAQQRPPHVWTLYACAVRLRQTPETAQRGLQIGRLVARGTTVRPLLADDAARTGSEPGIQDVRQDSTAAHTTRILPLKSPLDCGDGRHDGVRGLRDLRRRALAAPRSGGVSVLLRAIFVPAFSRDLKRVRRRRLDEGELATAIDLIIENTPEALKELHRRHRMRTLKGTWRARTEGLRIGAWD